MKNSREAIRPPHLGLLCLEAPRALGELGLFYAGRPLHRRLPRGDGHPVLVLPGMGADDFSTRPLRRALRNLGYHVHGWRQGINTGHSGLGAQVRQRLAAVHARHGRKVSLIGWSLGGIYARELAKLDPEHVRLVITLGSPFAGPANSSNVARLYRALSGRDTNDSSGTHRLAQAPPVASTALFSRTDGIVAWQFCLEPPGAHTENIEIHGSHCGLGHNPAALYAIADRLAQTENRWCRFAPPVWARRFYPERRAAA